MAIGNPYTEVSIVNYNVTPPTDGGEQTAGNTVEWAKHKTKLADPIKTLAESTQTNITAALDKRIGNNVIDKTGDYTVITADRGKIVRVTSASTVTITLPAVADAKVGFEIIVKNTGTGLVIVDGNASETIDGALTLSLLADQSVLLFADGTNWSVVSEAIGPGTSGQVLTQTGTGKQWEALAAGLQSIQSFLSPGAATWTRPVNIRRIEVTVIGSGGGGGTSDANGSGGGGGGGGTAIKLIDVSDLTFAPGDVSTGADTITITGHVREDDDKVQLTTTGTLPAPLALATDYWIVGVSGNDLQLAASKAGAAINLTDAGTGTHTLELISIDITVGGGAGSSFSSYCSATAGTVGGNGSVQSGGAGGVGSGGDINLNGGAGGSGSSGTAAGGNGGVAMYGAGGTAGGIRSNGVGVAGIAPGGGGSGRGGTAGGTGSAGSNGGIFVREFM